MEFLRPTEGGGGILLRSPVLTYDRASPLTSAAQSSALRWLKQLSDAQGKAAECCRNLQSATEAFVRAGESLSESMRELASLYAAGDAAGSEGGGASAAPLTSIVPPGPSASTISAGAGMLSELLTEVCSFSRGLSASLETAFRTPLGAEAGASFAQCVGTVAGAGTASESAAGAMDRLLRLRRGATPAAVMSCADELTRALVAAEMSRFDACAAVNGAESRGRVLAGEAVSGALFALHAFFRQCDASAGFHQARMDAFATAVGEGRKEAALRDAAWRAARDRLETSLVHVATPAPDAAAAPDAPSGSSNSSSGTSGTPVASDGGSIGVGVAAGRAVAPAQSYNQNVMAALVQRATAPVDAIHECVRAAALALRARQLGSTSKSLDTDSSTPAFGWPGLTYAFGLPAPRRPTGYPASAADVPIAGWLWRLDPTRWQRAWQRQWLFVSAGRLYCVAESAAAPPAADAAAMTPHNHQAGGSSGSSSGSGSRVMSSVAGAAIAFASAAYATAAAGFEDRLDAAPQLSIRAICDLATANIRFAALPPVDAAPPALPVPSHSAALSSGAVAPEKPAPGPKRSLLSRAVAAASSYMRGGPGDDAGGAGGSRGRRASGTPAAAGPPMGGGYLIPFALLGDDFTADGGSVVAAPDTISADDGDDLVETAALAFVPGDDAPAAGVGAAKLLSFSAREQQHPAQTPDSVGAAAAPPVLLPAPFAVLTAFELRAPHETFVFAALTAQQRRVWVDTLRRVSENEITYGHNAPASAASASGATSGAAKAAPALLSAEDTDALAAHLETCNPAPPTLPSAPSTRADLGAAAIAVRAILAANPSCSDCGAAAPDWVSLNLGCVFCLACSGVHRSLGAHVSRVRSLALDSIDAFALAALLRLGNAVVNAVYEDSALMAEQGAQKPGPHASRSERDTHIRAKYERRAFVSRHSGAVPEACAARASPRLLAALNDAAAPLARTLEAAAAEGCLPAVLLCLARGGVPAPPCYPLHAAADHRRWAVLYLLASFCGWSPPGEPDAAGRTVWQAALAAALEGAPPPAEQPLLLAALASLLLRPGDRPAALADMGTAAGGASGQLEVVA